MTRKTMLPLVLLALTLAACTAGKKPPAAETTALPDISNITEHDKLFPYVDKQVILTGTAVNYYDDPARPAVDLPKIGKVLLLGVKPWPQATLSKQVTASGNFIDIEGREAGLAEPMQYPHPDYALQNAIVHPSKK